MNVFWKAIVWSQFGASIDTLHDMLRACPDELWRERLWDTASTRPEYAEFWYRVYHTLFWLDLYLTGAEEGFVPPAPFDLVEMEAGETLPRTYTREELLGYLAYCRQRCRETLSALSTEEAYRLCRFPWGELRFAELQLYNLRHVQEHGAQLGMFLGQQVGKSTTCVSQAQKESF